MAMDLAISGPGLIVDNFAGGGGASTGIEQALGRPIDIAINHDEQAVAMHKANHPDTRHYTQSVWAVDPLDVVRAGGPDGRHAGQPVALAWFSPDCKHFSKAKGGTPRSKNIRDLAWVVVHWVERLKPFGLQPRVIMLENVEEFCTWGPLLEDGKPCDARKGETFNQWTARLRRNGYKVEFRRLKACDYGAPTSRKRLFMIARCDGQPIVWPAPTHGPDAASPYCTAADIIDWSISCPSIFERKRPLKDTTCRRIATGMMRFVINAERPFIVPITHTKAPPRPQSIDEPLRTVTTAKGGEFALAIPHLIPLTHHGSASRVYDPEQPLPTVTAAHRGEIALVAPILDRQFGKSTAADVNEPIGTIMPGGSGKTAMVAAFLAQHNGGPRNKNIAGRAANMPLSTIMGRGTQQQIVISFLAKLQNNQDAKPIAAPLDTILAGGLHHAEVRAFLIKYYGNENDGHGLGNPLGTVTTRDRFGLVTVSIEGVEYAIADIGMRMLTPRELFAAQGFPQSYVIAPEFNGKPMTKTSQVARCGNAVCPPLPRALVASNVQQLMEIAA